MTSIARDQLWEDDSGEEWRVTEVRKISRTEGGPEDLAYVRMRHVSGITAKIKAGELEGWKRVGPDPLAGKRRDIQRGAKRIVFPADRPCPIRQGEIFYLRGASVLAQKVSRKIVKGRPAEWHVELTRSESQPVHLLRASPPAHADHSKDRDLDAAAIRRAAVESAYTSSPVAAMPGEPESVGPEWRDTEAVAREAERVELRRRRINGERAQAEVDRTAAHLKQVGRTLGAKGHDLTGLLDDVLTRVAREEREVA